MKKILGIGILVLVVAVFCGVYVLTRNSQEETTIPEATPSETPDYKDIEISIDGQKISLVDGYAEEETAPGSASRTVTRYFGNELYTDLNGDGKDDVAFIVTQETGGTGLFYYAVGAVATESGYVGTDGYLLGDRIAPQSTTLSQNHQHEHVVVFNYAERSPDEPMSASPSVGKSAYLKLDTATLQWGVVEPDFEGEADKPTERYHAQVDRVDVTFEQWEYTQYRLTTNNLVRTGDLNTERGYGDDIDATVYVLDWNKPEGEQMRYVRLTSEPGRLYLLDTNNEIVRNGALILE